MAWLFAISALEHPTELATAGPWSLLEPRSQAFLQVNSVGAPGVWQGTQDSPGALGSNPAGAPDFPRIN
jgi:hypothetical protein